MRLRALLATALLGAACFVPAEAKKNSSQPYPSGRHTRKLKTRKAKKYKPASKMKQPKARYGKPKGKNRPVRSV